MNFFKTLFLGLFLASSAQAALNTPRYLLFGSSTQQPPFPVTSIILNDVNGHGSTATKIRTYAGVILNSGSPDISYTSDSVNGDKFTINTTGMYSVTLMDAFTSGVCASGVSVNASSLTTNINSLTWANGFRGYSRMGAQNITNNLTLVLKLTSGDIVRAQDDGTCDGGSGPYWFSGFSITRVN